MPDVGLALTQINGSASCACYEAIRLYCSDRRGFVPAKTQIVDFLREKALVLPALLDAAITGNEQAKYILSLLQMAVSYSEGLQGASAPSLQADREACGIPDAVFDHSVMESVSDGHGNFYIPGALRLVAILDDALNAMLAPLALLAGESKEARALYERYRERLDGLVRVRPAIVDDMMSGGTIADMTSGRPVSGDSVHLLIMDIHREINRLQGEISTEEIDGAKTYGLAETDRPLLAAFMRGVKRTASLKFDHPGLGTTAARAGGTLLIQNDLGTTEAHVLVVRVTETDAVVTHTDIHVQRLRFFQSLLEGTGVRWDELRSHQGSAITADDLFYVAHGRLEAQDPAALAGFLERLGSRLVFLIDWNRARKRLRLLVPNERAVRILRWAADHEYGHRAFLILGGERLVYDALEQAVKTPLRYGEPLHEMIGADVAQEYLCYVLQTTATGLLKTQSSALIRDQVRAELFNHFRSAEQRLLADAGRHASLIVQLASGLRTGLRPEAASGRDALTQNAARAKLAETRADEIVKETRLTVRRIPGTEIFCRILEVADDAADDLEDSAFLAGLLSGRATRLEAPVALLALSDLLVEDAQAFQRALGAAQHIHRGGAREHMQQFLEAVDHVATIEHETDEQERAVTAALVGSQIDCREFHLVSGISGHLESAADALLRASLMLRDHVLGEIMFV
jgi:uncharacterized protein Yka (UPF0111/DUF47 family)